MPALPVFRYYVGFPYKGRPRISKEIEELESFLFGNLGFSHQTLNQRVGTLRPDRYV